MNPSFVTVVGFAACLGALIGGGHGALVALAIVLGISIVITVWQALVLRGKVQQEPENLAAKANEATWDGIPADPTA